MKILHIWNTAGVASLLASTQRKYGHDASVFMRSSHDPYMFTSYYGGQTLNMSGGEFIREAIKEAKDYDIIHVHASYRILERLREEYPLKTIVLQHHGRELTTGDLEEVFKSYAYCDSIITSTHDLHELLNNKGIKNHYIPNAVDTNLFKPDNQDKNGALFINTKYIDTNSMLDFIGSIPYDIYVMERELEKLTFDRMPKLLNQFELYIDVKCPEFTNYKPVQAYSRTGLEALSCGLSVLNYKGDIVRGLAAKHTPEAQFIDVLSVYRSSL